MLIRKQDRLAIIALAKTHIKSPSQIWAFGSRVNGDAHDMSDLDLVVVADQKLDIGELMDFREALKNSNIPIIVQVLDWHRVPKSFHDNILMKYEVLTSSQ